LGRRGRAPPPGLVFARAYAYPGIWRVESDRGKGL